MWMVMLGIVLHGMCYDFFFVTGQIYVDKKAHAKIRGQAQGFLVLVTQGVGMLIGASAAGWIYETQKRGEQVNWQMLWFIPCIAAAIIAAIFVVSFKNTVTPEEVEA